ncbi:hypothetical protein NN561_007149 [Cricetulus griseus]
MGKEEAVRTGALEAGNPSLAPGLACVLPCPFGHSGTRRESKSGTPSPPRTQAELPARAPALPAGSSEASWAGRLARSSLSAAPAGCWSPGERSGCCERPSEQCVRYHPGQSRCGHPGCLPY